MHIRAFVLICIASSIAFGAAHDGKQGKTVKKSRIPWPLSSSDQESGRVKSYKRLDFSGALACARSTGTTVAQMAMLNPECSHLALYQSSDAHSCVPVCAALEGGYTSGGAIVPSLVASINQAKKSGRYRLKDGFKTFDRALAQMDDSYALSACVARLHSGAWPPRLYLANTGDLSAIVVDHEGFILHRTNPHTVYNPDEMKRLQLLGARVEHDGMSLQVAGSHITRTLGDRERKRKACEDAGGKVKVITADPELQRIDLMPYQEAYLIMATPDFWECMDHRLVAATVAVHRRRGRDLSDIIHEQFRFAGALGCANHGILAAEFSWQHR